jgi:hypothetical protein
LLRIVKKNRWCNAAYFSQLKVDVKKNKKTSYEKLKQQIFAMQQPRKIG